ncbi:hypothetical protein [Persicitalea jodogahamensis]|uniref:Uncharacterized protein n=1 Tax=Persicitalea jodogahamensis TaxID=402147 RepID=A0A8J3D5G9_9BACT|nr:hypothetical protein [Persicitalea jodogahamensis]GHB62743.1 hypothetical protein GCM10007390_15720 [Persicitalea jodogahamensis]
MSQLTLLLLLLITAAPLGCSPEVIKSIRLQEFTRGTQRSIEVDAEKTVVIINEAEETTKTDPVVWKELKGQILDLPLTALDKVTVLSKKHQFDGALAASLTITTPDSTYTSPTFDHNAPPAELKAIVDRLYQQVPAAMRERFGQ